MTKQKPAGLAGLVTKGNATPAAGVASGLHTIKPGAKTIAKTPAPRQDGAAQEYHAAITVKLTRDRYMSVKAAGAERKQKTQQIMVEALDEWLQKNRP